MELRLRPEQMALMEGDARPVGPLPESVVRGDNSALLASVSEIYLRGSVLDVTYGRGMWWRRFTPATFGHHDLALDGVDFRDLPHADRSWDAVCFDPPYVPRQGIAPATRLEDAAYRQRYGLAVSRGRAELELLIGDGLAECARVARQWVLVKCCDYVNGKQFHLGHVFVIRAGEGLGLRVHDLIVHAAGSGPGGGQITTVKRARRAHSYLIVFSVPKARGSRAAA